MGAIRSRDEETKSSRCYRTRRIVIDEAQMVAYVSNTRRPDPNRPVGAGEVSVTEIGRWQLVIDQADLSG